MADRRDFPFEQIVESLPYSIEAEQAVIGAIIADSRVIDDVAGILVPEYFYNGQNLQIFKEILLLSALGKPIDFVTVLNAVITSSIFEKEEDAKVYLYSITQSVPTISNVATYAKIVYDKYLLRSVIRICREVTDNAVTAGENAAQILDYAEQKLYEIRAGRDNSEMWRIDSVLFDVIDRLNKMSGPDAYKYRGIPTGFGYLDKVLTGLNKSDLIILAARPGVGKTSLALNIATNIARKTDYAVAMFSLEMSKQQLAQRIISNVSGVSSYAFRTGEVSSEEWVTIAEGMSILTGTGIYLDDTSGISVSEIKSKARRLKNLGLIVVDYLQLMGGSGRRDSRVNEIADITRSFKILAKDLNVPVIVLSQLSRSNEKEAKPRRPRLSDLRDSGSIEQDADIVIFLHRDHVESDDEENSTESKQVTLMVAKNRHGETANMMLGWDGEHTRFSSLEYRDEQ